MSATCLLQLGAAFRALSLELFGQFGFGAYWDSPKTVAALGVSAFLYAGDILRCESADMCELRAGLDFSGFVFLLVQRALGAVLAVKHLCSNVPLQCFQAVPAMCIGHDWFGLVCCCVHVRCE